jgi:NAD-dependent histone deacetylase SIR2
MGTSLSVQPFASLPQMARHGRPRVLINQEVVGGLGSRPDDVLVLGDCDEGVRKLAEACGWLGELEELWEGTKLEEEKGTGTGVEKTADEKLEEEIERLTREVDETLDLARWHGKKVREDLVSDVEKGGSGSDDDEPRKLSSKKEAHTDEHGDLRHVFVTQAREDGDGKESKI